MEHVICDVLVVGGGGAALRAAIAAKEKEPAATVVVVTKGKLGHSGVTATACSDRMAFHATLAQTEPKGPDNWLYHAEDIHKIGGQVSDWNLAEILARESAAAFDYLDRLGVPFVRMGGRVLQFVTDGSVYPRACYTGPRTAVHIEEAIVKRLGNLDIKVIEHAMVAKLLKNKDRVCGALVLDAREKDSVRRGLLEVQAKTIVLATGGGGLIYRHNVFPAGISGDGYALAYEAGAELVNMEFVQLGLAAVRTKLNCSGSLLRAVPRLVDENGREILDDYLPPGTDRANLADIVFRKGGSWPVSFEHDTHLLDIAVYKEVQHGHRVYLDYNVNPAGFDFSQLPTADQERYKEEIVEDFGSEARKASPLARLREINPASIEWLREHGIDLALGDLVEIACCGQHFEGGVKIGSKGETTVPGLYAAGEVAGGQHGANRPGGNALLDGQVFGRIAGESAVLDALGTPITFVAEAELQEDIARWEALRGEGGVPARDYRRRIQEIVEAAAGVVRTEDGLRQGLCNLSKLAEEHACLAGWPVAQGLENSYMLIVAEMVLQAALMRDESRGHHLRFVSERDSMPVGRRDPEWQQYLVIFRDGQEMRLEKRTPC